MKAALRKLIVPATLALLLAGCAGDPLLTNKPQDWQGHPASDLKAAWGEPNKITSQSDGEYWEYYKSGDYLAPPKDSTSFRIGGSSSGYTSDGLSTSGFGANGGITTTKQGERVSHFENVTRFLIRDGKVRKWSAARIVDGETVWSDH